MPTKYFLIGNVATVDIHEEFSSHEDAHARWDELRGKVGAGECNLKLKEMWESQKPKLTLSQKIAAITNACGEIIRNGVGTSSDPDKPLYTYVKVEDVLAMVAPLLKRYKLIVTGQVAKEPVTHVSKGHATTEVLVDWTLTDTEADADPIARDMMYNCARVYRIPRSGADDSGKAIYKAITGIRKYFYVTVFNLKFGDEPEEVANAMPKAENNSTAA